LTEIDSGLSLEDLVKLRAIRLLIRKKRGKKTTMWLMEKEEDLNGPVVPGKRGLAGRLTF
jgi:hypothetical protein